LDKVDHSLIDSHRLCFTGIPLRILGLLLGLPICEGVFALTLFALEGQRPWLLHFGIDAVDKVGIPEAFTNHPTCKRAVNLAEVFDQFGGDLLDLLPPEANLNLTRRVIRAIGVRTGRSLGETLHVRALYLLAVLHLVGHLLLQATERILFGL